MANLVHATATRNAIADTVDAQVNAGVGVGRLEFQTSGDVEVATIALQDPAFGAAASGVITLAGVPLSDTSATGGTVAKFRIYDEPSAGNEILSGDVTVTSGGGDIEMSSLVVGAGDTVTLNSLTWTAPT